MQEFELEMDGKRKSLNEEMKSRLDALQYKEDEITHREEKLGRLELLLENKSEREWPGSENEKSEREVENLLKSDGKRMDLRKRQMLVDKDSKDKG